MKKPKELRLIELVFLHCGRIPTHYWEGLTKMDYRFLEKWTKKGYWEYGVTLRSGWLTDRGREVLRVVKDSCEVPADDGRKDG